MINLVKGTKDLFAQELEKHKTIIQAATKIANLFNFQELQTPIIERAEVFLRTLGDCSDIVNKEIYTFLDKNNESIALRPEFTAAVMRYILSIDQRILARQKPFKLFSYGPLFRYDRPQAGRQRQFSQLNFEIFNANSVFYDAEIIQAAKTILDNLNINNYNIVINSLGNSNSKKIYEEMLFKYFKKYENDLSSDSIARLNKNPLRILDSKDLNDQKIAKNAPKISQAWDSQDKKDFDILQNYLNNININYIHDEKLVRGLDYYNGPIFEFISSDIGAQSSILGGGRYDSLYNKMGGKAHLSAVGFGAGIERLAIILPNYNQKEKIKIAILPISESEYLESFKIVNILRQNNIICEVLAYEAKISKKLELSSNIGASYVIIIGENEIINKKYQLKKINQNIQDTTENAKAYSSIEAYNINKDTKHITANLDNQSIDQIINIILAKY
ncbi:MAG: histidine--tRNA ligase [Rickettsiales bacterium]